MHQEHTVEPKQQGEIFEPYVVTPFKESYMLLTTQEDFPLLDEEKVQQECKNSLGTLVVKSEFYASSFYKLFIVHEVIKFDNWKCLMQQYFMWVKIRLYRFTHPPIDFIILDKFNDIVERKVSLFLVLSKVLHELVLISWEKVLVLEHF